MAEDYFEDYAELEHESSVVGITDRLEWLIDTAFRSAAFMLMPWRWFQNPDDESHYYHNPSGKPSIVFRLQYPFLVAYDFTVSRFGICLDLLEFFTSTVLSVAARLFTLRRKPVRKSKIEAQDG